MVRRDELRENVERCGNTRNFATTVYFRRKRRFFVFFFCFDEKRVREKPRRALR